MNTRTIPITFYTKPMNTQIPKIFLFIAILLKTQSSAFATEAPWVGFNFKGLLCSGGAQGYGPYDYTSKLNRKNKLPIVNKNHFTKGIERHEPKPGRHNVTGDIDYTLRAFPKHHKALISIARYQLKINAGYKLVNLKHLSNVIFKEP